MSERLHRGGPDPIAENVNTLVTWPHYHRPREANARAKTLGTSANVERENAQKGEEGRGEGGRAHR